MKNTINEVKKALKILFMIFGGMFTLLILIGIIAVANSDSEEVANNDNEPAIEQPIEKPKEEDPVIEEEIIEEPKEEIIKLSATELINAYDSNEIRADKTYEDEKVEITGTIEDFGEAFLSDIYVIFDSNEKYVYTSVQALFKDKESIDKLAELDKGQEITIIGTVSGLSLTNIIVKNCIIK